MVAGTILVGSPQLLNQKAQVVGYVPPSNCPNGGSKACEFPNAYSGGYEGRYCRNEGGQMVIYTCNKVKGTLGCPDYWVKSLVENCSLRSDGATSCNSSGQCYQYCSPSVNCPLGTQRCGNDGVTIQECVESKVGVCTTKYWQSLVNCTVLTGDTGAKCVKTDGRIVCK